MVNSVLRQIVLVSRYISNLSIMIKQGLKLLLLVTCIVISEQQNNEGQTCECVPYYMCNSNGTINTNGDGVIDIRMGSLNNPSR